MSANVEYGIAEGLLQKWDKFYNKVNFMRASTSGRPCHEACKKACFAAILGAKY
jgi:hypothetical protein